MDRRTFIAAGASALAGVVLRSEAVAAVRLKTDVARARAWGGFGSARSLDLVPPEISRDRVIKTTVGLRPHRDSGFVLRAEKFDHKTVIHNYGHGGAGMSLAWGTGSLAADLALKHKDRRAAVLGCGSVGLTAARQLQRRGFAVTIYAKAVPPDTTSNMSLASFTPASGLAHAGHRTRAWDEQFRKAAAISYHQLQALAGGEYGVYWIDQYFATDDLETPAADGDSAALLDVLRSGRDRERLGPGEHPFPTTYAIRTPSLSIEPGRYLGKLVGDFLASGGHIVIRAFETPHELMSLRERVIVNCTGLGSSTLFNDQQLVPVKGQLSLLTPQPEVKYRVSRHATAGDADAANVSMNPRSDGIVIGNLQERGSWSLEPSEDVRDRNINAAIAFFDAMRDRIES